MYTQCFRTCHTYLSYELSYRAIIELTSHATKIGAIGLILWSFAAFFNSQLLAMPIFEILSFALGIGFVGGILRIIFTRSWYKLKQPIYLYLIGFAGVYGNEVLYVSSFKFAPASHIVLINYLWPILVSLFACLIPKEKFSSRYFWSAVIGFMSVAVVILNGDLKISAGYWTGYAMVFLGACMWSLYVLVYRASDTMSSEMLTVYCGLGCIISITIHCNTEVFYLPNLSEMFSLLWLGLIGMCIAFNFWDFGVKNGNVKLLSILSYNNIVLSTAILIILGEAHFDPLLAIATIGLMIAYLLLLVSASFLSALRLEFSLRKKN